MDQEIFYFINNFVGRFAWLDAIAIFLTGLFLYVFIGLVAGIAFKNREYKFNAIVGFVSALILRGVVVEVLKRLVERPRPFETMAVHKLIDEDLMHSFPSGHTVIFFSIAFAFYGTKLFWPLVILSAVASVARIYAGAHYPSDVLASVVIAALGVPLVWALFKKLNFR